MDIYSADQKINYRSRPLIFIDLETTGLDVQKYEIIEIGALRVNPEKPFRVEEMLSLKVKPININNADKEALKINGYTEKKWVKAIDLDKALKMLEEFSKQGVMVGFNVSFDWAFLHKAYSKMGQEEPFHYHRLDVLSMAYLKLFDNPKITKFNLSALCVKFKVQRGNKHQALADAKATYLVFKKLLNYTEMDNQ